MILVVPEISDNQQLYGIYAFVISLSLYFTYADIGFISAGQKFASESFSKKDYVEEMHIIGFVISIMFFMFIPISLLFLYLSSNVEIVFKNLSLSEDNIASNLFIVLASLVPFQIIFQRTVTIFFSIRLLDYVIVRIDILFNLIKVFSLYVFFSENTYMIVEYFLFCTLMSIASSIIGFLYLNFKLGVSFVSLLKSINISSFYFQKTRTLAFSSAATTLGFVLYYELDLVLVGAFFGTKEVATYAVAFTFIGFLRRLWSIIYTPISVRINHLIGVNKIADIKILLNRALNYTFPINCIGIFTLVLGAKYLVLLWVGPEYIDSIVLIQLLLISFSVSYLTNVGFHYFVAFEKHRYLYALAFALPFVFIISLLILYNWLGVESFAYSKICVAIIEFSICWIGLKKIINPLSVLKKWLFLCLVWSFLLILLFPYIIDFLNLHSFKSTLDLLLLLGTISVIVIISYLSMILNDKESRNELGCIFRIVFKKKEVIS